MLIEKAPDAANALAGAQGLRTDVAKNLEGSLYERLRPIQQPLAGLGKRSDRAERLVQLVRNAARHLGKRRDPGNLHQLIENGLRTDQIRLPLAQWMPYFVAYPLAIARAIPPESIYRIARGRTAANCRSDLRRPLILGACLSNPRGLT